MSGTMGRYEEWKAPREDGQWLIWPAADELLRQTEANHARLSGCGAVIQGVALSDLRKMMRGYLGHDDAKPLIATGHQTELYHPGVWVKNVLIDRVARRLGGDAAHFSVDTDAPKHLNIQWPGGVAALTDDPAAVTAPWSGLLASPTPAHLLGVRERVATAAEGWSFTPMFEGFFDSMRRLAMQEVELAPALANSLHFLDWELGLRHQALVASPLWSAAAYLVFTHHLIARATELAGDYNASLADFRREHGIDDPGRPMPDLAVGPESCETPFWLDDLAGDQRGRLTVERMGQRWTLRRGEEAFAFDPDAEGWSAARELGTFLRQARLRISPRALTLTMFLRLVTVDQFVHGIGGGRYDQVCDRLIERHFGIDPPGFAVTTATLFFPEAVGRSRVCLPCLAMEGHHLRHGVLGEEKREMVRAIGAAPRYGVERQLLFRQMHHRLDEAADSEAIKAFERRLAEARREAERDAEVFDRELFYAIQPAERLEGLIEAYRRAMGG